MITNIITVHSFKGGTGKSLLASALAYYCASERKEKTLVVDCDFGAPSLRTFFPPKKEKDSLVELLTGKCRAKKVISLTSTSNLDIIYSPEPDKAKEILQMDAKWHARALQNMLGALKELQDENYRWIFFDNQNGITLTSVNFLTLSNSSLVVLRPSRYAVAGTFNIGQTIFKRLSLLAKDGYRNDFLVWNQIPEGHKYREVSSLISEWNEKFLQSNITPIAEIPYNVDIAEELFLHETYEIKTLTNFFDKWSKQIVRAILGT